MRGADSLDRSLRFVQPRLLCRFSNKLGCECEECSFGYLAKRPGLGLAVVFRLVGAGFAVTAGSEQFRYSVFFLSVIWTYSGNLYWIAAAYTDQLGRLWGGLCGRGGFGVSLAGRADLGEKRAETAAAGGSSYACDFDDDFLFKFREWRV